MPLRVAITGAEGQLGQQLVRAFTDAGNVVVPLTRRDFDITAHDTGRLAAAHPDVVINCAAWTDVDACARDPQRAMLVNGRAAGAVARAAAEAGALIVQISTNEVFDGSLERAYTEDDAPRPINPYGASKLAGEQLVASENARHLIVRTAWIFGAGSANFVTKILAAADRAEKGSVPLTVVSDEWGNPTPAEWLATAIQEIAERAVGDPRDTGVWHIAGRPPISRLGWAEHLLRDRAVVIEPVTLADYPRDTTVPPRAVLSSRRRDLGAAGSNDWRPYSDRLARAE